MTPGRLIRIVGFATAVLAAASCAVAPVLEMPDGGEMCAGVLAGEVEPYWFGVQVSNSGLHTVELMAVQLGEQDHIALNDAFVVPPVQQIDGTMLGVGIMYDPSTESPDLWAGRQPVAGYMIPPKTTVFLALALSRDAAETGQVRSQIITYRVDGEFYDREATSRLRLALTDDCQTLDEDP